MLTQSLRVAVYAIALNEEQFVDRFMDTAVEADVVVVADTGSTDATIDRLRSRGAAVHEICVRPWRFDDARTASLALVPAGVDVCVSLDLDEVLPPGWRVALERDWGEATRGRYLYVWNHRTDGTPDVSYYQDKIHLRHGYRWVYACHEHLVPDRIEERFVDLDFTIHHWADDTKSRSNYLPLLEVNAKEYPHLPRAAHYLGREYVFNRQWADALRELERHVTMPESTWMPERAASYRLMARCLVELERSDEAVAAARSATDDAPEMRESWVTLAQTLHDLRRWPECLEAAERALDITDPPVHYLREGWAWGPRAADLASVAAWWTGQAGEALDYARKAAALDPSDDRLAANVTYIEANPRST